MLQTIIAITLSIILVAGSITHPAAAIQSPSGCNSNRLTLSITRDKLTVQQGDILIYTISLSNIDSGPNIACDIDSATLTVTLPALDGSPTGQVVTLQTGASYPAGTTPGVVGTVPYTVNVNPGVIDASAEARVQGVLHDAPTDHAADISKTIGTTIVWPTAPSASDSTTPTANLPGMPNTAVAM